MSSPDLHALFLSSLPSLPLFALQAAAAIGMISTVLVLTRQRGLAIRQRSWYLGLGMGLTLYLIAWFVSDAMKGPVKLNLSTDLLLLSGLLGGVPGGAACFLLSTLARLQFAGSDRLLASMLDTAMPVLLGCLLHGRLFPAIRQAFALRTVLLVWGARIVATYAGFALGLSVLQLPSSLIAQLLMLRLLVLPLSFCILYLALHMVHMDAQIDVQHRREHQLARTDAISGLPNRLALEECLVALSPRAGCLLVLELYKLRDFLLHYGPQYGSRLWQELDDVRQAPPLWQTLQPFRPQVFQYGDFALAVVLHDARLPALEASGAVDAFLDGLAVRIATAWPHYVPVFRCAVVELDAQLPGLEPAYRNITLALNARDSGIAYFNDILRHDTGLDSEIESAFDSWRLAPHLVPMHLQPKVRISDGALLGAEALLRMPHASGQAVPAMRVISLLRQRGRLAEFEWVSLQAVVAMLPRLRARFPALCVAVNVSTESLCRPDFASGLCQLMARHGMPGSALRLEVVEWSDVLQLPQVARNMQCLAEDGFSLSLDDFGAGYSTLMLLTRFAFSEVKLEQSLVADLDNQKACNVVMLAVEAAHRSGAQVVAEGTETADMLARVRSLGVDVAQGYLFAPALDLPSFLQLPAYLPLPAGLAAAGA
ncbi:EAL domain-containing protein [Vogesella sp. DC21W]|uniref:EAL domain-containing protein n=1 Tax=Vogesella aquatica TaxID=2984206 RepID=A0ABT5IXD5_9NEIS|nr:EAL domain-containing protein [Vogesella aquatica]MDC7716284.1 EAL domain-containing protein [Vogesella aquatica]